MRNWDKLPRKSLYESIERVLHPLTLQPADQLTRSKAEGILKEIEIPFDHVEIVNSTLVVVLEDGERREQDYRWTEEYLKHIQALDNMRLYEEVLKLAGGDWYEGMFTKKGQWRFEKIKEEFRSRLAASGYFGGEW